MSWEQPRKPRWQDRVIDAAKVVSVILIVFAVLGSCTVAMYDDLKRGPSSTWPCEDFKDYDIQHVPARCASYYGVQR